MVLWYDKADESLNINIKRIDASNSPNVIYHINGVVNSDGNCADIGIVSNKYRKYSIELGENFIQIHED